MATAVSQADPVTIQDYTKLFNSLSDSSTVVYNGVVKDWSDKNGIAKQITNRVITYVNGNTNYMTLNRFIQTIKLIFLIKNGKQNLSDLNNKTEINLSDFEYMEYTFIPDPEHNQLTLPLQMYEIKTFQDSTVNTLTNQIKKKHRLNKDDYLYICDMWKHKIHQQLTGTAHAQINRRTDDIFVYYKVQPTSISLAQRCAFAVNFKSKNKLCSFPLLIFLNKTLSITMTNLYRKLCKIIAPFMNDILLKNAVAFISNLSTVDINSIVFRYVRMEYTIHVPDELKLLIINYTIFDLPQNLPFEIEAYWREISGHRQTQGIKDNEDVFDLPKFHGKNVGFEFNFHDDTKLNHNYYCMENRTQVKIESLEGINITKHDDNGDDDEHENYDFLLNERLMDYDFVNRNNYRKKYKRKGRIEKDAAYYKRKNDKVGNVKANIKFRKRYQLILQQ